MKPEDLNEFMIRYPDIYKKLRSLLEEVDLLSNESKAAIRDLAVRLEKSWKMNGIWPKYPKKFERISTQGFILNIPNTLFKERNY